MDKHRQLKERKFRKGAVHSRKKIFTADKSEEHERNCNICNKIFLAQNKFIRFCNLCREEEEYKFGYDLTTYGKGDYIT